MNRKIAFLACPATLPGAPDRSRYAFEHDTQVAVLRKGLEGSGVELVEIDWRAPLDTFAGFAMALIGSSWDYTEAKDAFITRLAALEATGVMVCNPLEVVRWNADKIYLKALAQNGAPSIPTLWPEAPGPSDITAAFDHFDCEQVVVKRRVAAGAVGQASFRRGDAAIADWAMDQPAMIQPFLPAIQSEGEFSFVFIDGCLSHALVKRAKAGDYRIQSQYGGKEMALEPTPADRAAAEAVLAMLPLKASPLYARIDMVRLPQGALAVIEAELIEPYLYPLSGPQFGARMAEAILRRLDAAYTKAQ